MLKKILETLSDAMDALIAIELQALVVVAIVVSMFVGLGLALFGVVKNPVINYTRPGRGVIRGSGRNDGERLGEAK